MTLDSYIAGALLVVASAVVAVLGLIVVRKSYNVRTLAGVHDLSSQYLSIVGTMYAVLLGLIVVDAMQHFQQAITTVEEEANALSELIYLSGRMPAPVRTQVHDTAVGYAQLVIDREWPLLAQGHSLPEARASALELMRLIRDWEPEKESEKAVYASAVSAASQFWNCRRERIVGCQRGVPFLEWAVVILGGIVTVGLTYVFVFEDLKIQIALTAMVSLLISLNIFLVLMFGYPYSGDVSVKPDSFHEALAAAAIGTAGAQPPTTSK